LVRYIKENYDDYFTICVAGKVTFLFILHLNAGYEDLKSSMYDLRN